MAAKRVLLFLVYFFVQTPSFPAICGETGENTSPGEKPPLVVGYSRTVFFNVDINDARASAKVWTEVLVRNGNVFGKSDTLIFHDLPSTERALKARSVDIVILRPEEFLEIRNRTPLDPVFATDFGKYFYGDFLLLVRADSEIRQLSQLEHKRLIIEVSQSGSIPGIWLETLLMKAGLGELKDFSTSIKEAHKGSEAVLPLFFKQADATLVSRSAFDTMAELNPQIGKELKALAVSPSFLTGMVCFRRDMPDKYKVYLENYLGSLHTYPQGKQLLMLFRANRLVPFKLSYLEDVETLLREHKNLKLGIAKR